MGFKNYKRDLVEIEMVLRDQGQWSFIEKGKGGLKFE